MWLVQLLPKGWNFLNISFNLFNIFRYAQILLFTCILCGFIFGKVSGFRDHIKEGEAGEEEDSEEYEL